MLLATFHRDTKMLFQIPFLKNLVIFSVWVFFIILTILYTIVYEFIDQDDFIVYTSHSLFLDTSQM